MLTRCHTFGVVERMVTWNERSALSRGADWSSCPTVRPALPPSFLDTILTIVIPPFVLKVKYSTRLGTAQDYDGDEQEVNGPSIENGVPHHSTWLYPRCCLIQMVTGTSFVRF